MTSREPRAFLEDIRTSARMVGEYVQGQDFAAFRGDAKTQDAVVHRLELIGEAAGKLPIDITGAMAEVPWAEIKSMRNLLVHQYWDIDFKLLWTVVHDDLPLLARAIDSYLTGEP